MAVGRFLSSHLLRRGELGVLARIVGVSPRTLRNWRDREGQCRSPGRPGHSAAARARAREQTARVLDELPRGHDGWRSVCALLERAGIGVPVRLVQESLAAIKRESRVRTRERIETERVQVDVLARDALWGVDQTFLGRDERGASQALLVREMLVPHTLGLSIGSPARGEDVVRLLEQVAGERGGFPFVIQMDNGSENRNDL